MKQIFKAVGVMALTAVVAVGFAACSVQPDFGKNSYKVDNAYRVVELDESKTKFIEDYGIEGVALKNNIGIEIEYTCDHFYIENSLFFNSGDQFSKEAIKVIYNCLGVDKYPQIEDEVSYYCTSSSLWTQNRIIQPSVHLTATVKYENGIMPGYVSDVNRYTFNYVDYFANGEAVGSGTFSVLLCLEEPWLSSYEYEKFTSLYNDFD